MGEKGFRYYFDWTWPGWSQLHPFGSHIHVSIHVIERCFLFPGAWGDTDYIATIDYPEGAFLTRHIMWQWLWIQLRVKCKIRSQAEVE